MYERRKLNQAVVAVPATKSASAVDVASDPYHDFATGPFGGGVLTFGAEDASKITDNVTFTHYASFDDGVTWLKTAKYTDLLAASASAAVQETVSFVIESAGGTIANYSGKYFILYSGTTPYLVWFDHTGSATKPTVTGFTTCADIECTVFGETESVDGLGAAIAADIDASSAFAASYNSGTNTMTITVSASGLCTEATSGNLQTGTAVTSAFGVATQGKAADNSISYSKILDIAPYHKVVMNYDSSAALASGHGIFVDLELQESDREYRRYIFDDCLSIGTSLDTGFADQYSDSLYVPSTYNVPYKLVLATYVGDKSKITDTIKYCVESSNDGENWWVASAALTDIANGSGTGYTVTTITNGSTYVLGKYFRIKLYRNSNDLDAAIASSHGIKFNVILEY